MVDREKEPRLRRNMNAKAQRSISLVGLFWALVVVASGLASLFTIAGFLGRYWWVFDLTSHFRLQYLPILLISAGVVARKRRKTLASALAVLAIVNLAVIAPYLPYKSVPRKVGQTLRAVLINVHTGNTRYDLVRRFIAEKKPDFFVLEEVDFNWIDQMAELRRAYPHFVLEPRDDNFGIALFSRLPLKQTQVIPFGDAEIPSILASVQIDDRQLKILATHPLPPGSREYSQLRNLQLSAIPSWVEKAQGETVLLGDLNITPWCSPFRKLLAETGLRDSSKGRGIQGTWPTYLLPMRIPIDHCLLSSGLQVVAKEIGPGVGSDHFPLLIEFAFVQPKGN